jgi:hypothetical protein
MWTNEREFISRAFLEVKNLYQLVNPVSSVVHFYKGSSKKKDIKNMHQPIPKKIQDFFAV